MVRRNASAVSHRGNLNRENGGCIGMAETLKLHARIEAGEHGRLTYVEADVPLRDLFAAFALAGMLANSGYHFDGSDDDTERAAQAYSFADSMIGARSAVIRRDDTPPEEEQSNAE